MKYLFLFFSPIIIIGLFSCSDYSIHDNTVDGNSNQTLTSDRIFDDLGIELPSQAADVKYVRIKPSEQIEYIISYIKFEATASTYEQFIEKLQMENYFDSTEIVKYNIPSSWDPVVEIEWWDASLDIPPTSVTRQFGKHGWIAGKYERGVVYFVITDN